MAEVVVVGVCVGREGDGEAVDWGGNCQYGIDEAVSRLIHFD